MCLRCEHTVDLVEAVRDDVGDLFVIADTDERDEIDLTGHRVDLADALQLCDLLGDLGNPVDSGGDEDDRGDHGVDPSADSPRATARSTTRARSSTRFAKARPNRASCAATVSGSRAASTTAPAIQL